MANNKIMNGTAMYNIVYSPALRLKEGEYHALSQLAPAIMERVTPLFIVPPPKEEDPETGLVWASAEQAVTAMGSRVGHYWPLRPSYVDARFLFKAFPKEDPATWLPRLFAVARNSHAVAIPVATLDDMVGPDAKAFQMSMSPSTCPIKLGIRISFSEIDESSLAGRVEDALKAFGLSSSDCSVFLDFSIADMSNPVDVATFISVAVECLMTVGAWQNIVYQGTNYPKKNPADPGSFKSIPRNEWLAWCEAIRLDPDLLKHCAYGDYAADCAPEIVKGGGGRAIVHYRYATPASWEVYRAPDGVSHKVGIRNVCNRLLTSGYFSGPNFSEADRYIQSTAMGYAPGGTATTWREMNTVRHITMVMGQLSQQQGFSVEAPLSEEEDQGELF